MKGHSIIDGIYDEVDKILGIAHIGKSSPHFQHIESWQYVSEQKIEELNVIELIRKIYRCIESNWESNDLPPGRSAANWKLRRCLKYKTEDEEIILERFVATHYDGWWNQTPIVSGLMGSRSHRRMAIDLIFCCYADMAYDFVELKIASNTPLYAAIEILIYGVLYVFSRVHADALGYSGKELSILKAKDVNLCVLAPTDFYFHGNQSYNLEWLAESLNSGIQRFAEEKVSGSVKMGFRFEACLHEDFGPDEIKGKIQKYSTKPLPEWVSERHL